VNRFAVNADYALETSQTALTEVKKIWKSSTDTLTLATGWLKDHLTIGALARLDFCSTAAADALPRRRCRADPNLLAVPPPFGPQQQPQAAAGAADAPAGAAGAAGAAGPAAQAAPAAAAAEPAAATKAAA
jgi:hypothetical protein